MTIKDIAEMAHVSKGTVSRVINGVTGVGDDTRRRVLKLIESLDFHPNASARGLAARKTNTMGFVIPHTGKYTLTSTFWPVFLTVVTQEAAARGINVLLSTAQLGRRRGLRVPQHPSGHGASTGRSSAPSSSGRSSWRSCS